MIPSSSCQSVTAPHPSLPESPKPQIPPSPAAGAAPLTVHTGSRRNKLGIWTGNLDTQFLTWEAQFGTLLIQAGKSWREEELRVSSSSHYTCPSQLPLLHHSCRRPAKNGAERTQGEAQTHLKWSWRATLKSKASPLSTKPTPMNARRPGQGGGIRAGMLSSAGGGMGCSILHIPVPSAASRQN